MNKEKCGCEVQFFPDVCTIYCPVHAAAFQMREALRAINKAVKSPADNKMAGELIEQALALAEGKEAEHGK